jgi:hypothetical protein
MRQNLANTMHIHLDDHERAGKNWVTTPLNELAHNFTDFILERQGFILLSFKA